MEGEGRGSGADAQRDEKDWPLTETENRRTKCQPHCGVFGEGGGT